jgi:hypothetical protein
VGVRAVDEDHVDVGSVGRDGTLLLERTDRDAGEQASVLVAGGLLVLAALEDFPAS